MPQTIDRRSMLAAAAVGGVALAGSGAGAQSRTGDALEIYELRTYRLIGSMKARLDAYLETAFIPAARRAGCGPVGAFTTAIGMGSANVQLLVPHPSIAAFLALSDKLAADAEYRRAAAAYADAPLTSPPYVSLEVKLMRAFRGFPRIEAPGPGKGRIFELRTYHSHSEKAGATKIDMFDTGGEIDIFRRTGLTPVFFAQDLTGTHLPSLTYMLTFPDLPTRERSWKAFGGDPAWQRLIAMPGLAETVTDIDNQILNPTRYSQV
ncbi:NIPSNAP family containing protein [Nostoc sp. 3335mG]|nr:NIPSNAP family containing protein [Nostoc sp. 3335mG]